METIEDTWDTADVKTCPHGYVFISECKDCSEKKVEKEND